MGTLDMKKTRLLALLASVFAGGLFTPAGAQEEGFEVPFFIGSAYTVCTLEKEGLLKSDIARDFLRGLTDQDETSESVQEAYKALREDPDLKDCPLPPAK